MKKIIICLSLLLLTACDKVYKIEFDSVGGTMIDSQQVKKENKVTKPVNPIKNGYIFKGWFIENNEFDFGTLVNSDLLLTAKWESDGTIQEYPITFNVDGDKTTEKYTNNQVINEPINPKKSGYTFDGWYEEGKEEKYNFETLVNRDITLVAKFKDKSSSNQSATTIFVTGITLSVDSLSLKKGETNQLIVSYEPANATNKDVSFESNNSKIVTINKTGLITAKKAGSARITVSTTDGGGITKILDVEVLDE